MTQEKLEQVLKSHHAIENVQWTNYDEYGFSRNITFTIRGAEYRILWYCNYSELFCGELCIVGFEYIDINGCYPNHFKNNLNFRKYGAGTIAVIPLEEYPKQS